MVAATPGRALSKHSQVLIDSDKKKGHLKLPKIVRSNCAKLLFRHKCPCLIHNNQKKENFLSRFIKNLPHTLIKMAYIQTRRRFLGLVLPNICHNSV